MIGKTISHYKIIEKLGEGGMGVVYKAQDTKLKRLVALKFISAQILDIQGEKTRLLNEAQAVAALDHPNICSIFEIDEFEGQTFMVMGYIEGQSLKERISIEAFKLDKALDTTIQIAEGLKEAHEQGIIHRDIKSGNILVTLKGQVKIMDFGLAKLVNSKPFKEDITTAGTVAYMSPEQARGGEVDHRTDIWSLGVVMYEMITGQLPFKGEYEQAVLYSIMNEDPEPISDLPDELKIILGKALSKNLESRYQSAGDFLIDLRKARKKLSSVIVGEQTFVQKSQPSIAVLPFTNLSADPEQEYFCDGVAEEIINALTHVEGLRVVARTSSFAFKGKSEDIREIGKKLNVETLLEGSVQKAGNRVRISTQLINVADGYHLWSERYDRNIGELCCPDDIFAIQDEISLTVVDKLKVKLLGWEKAKILKHHTADLDAYNLYLKGRYFWNKRTEKELKKAIDCFNRSIEIDPTYALAHAGLADSYAVLPDYSLIPSKEAYPKGREAALKALDIDSELAEAHASLAVVKGNYDWDWEGAEEEFKQAIKLNPGYAIVRHWYALLLKYMGRYDKAIAEMDRARKLDPVSLIINRNFGAMLYYAGYYKQAMKQLKKTIEMDPNFIYTHAFIGLVYLEEEKNEEALLELQKEKEICGDWNPFIEASLSTVYSKMGKKEKVEEILNAFLQKSRRSYINPSQLALVYFTLGKKDEGFSWLYKAYEERDSWLRDIKTIKGFDNVRSDLRLKALLKKMGLEK